MGYLLYSRRNPKRSLPIITCSLLALMALLFLFMLSSGIELERELYIEAFRDVTVLRPLGSVQPLKELIGVNENHLSAKLTFGRARLPLFEVKQKDLSQVLSLLGIEVEVLDSTSLLIQSQALKALLTDSGLSTLQSVAHQEFDMGPRAAIRILRDEEPTEHYLVKGLVTAPPSGYVARSYASEKRALDEKGSFIQLVLYIIVGIVFLSLVMGTAATVQFSVRGRYQELAILQVLGHDQKEVMSRVLMDLLVLVTGGAVVGLGLGWVLGYALMNALSVAGLPTFWPSGILPLILAFIAILILTGVMVTYHAVSLVDPVSVVQKSDEIS